MATPLALFRLRCTRRKSGDLAQRLQPPPTLRQRCCSVTAAMLPSDCNRHRHCGSTAPQLPVQTGRHNRAAAAKFALASERARRGSGPDPVGIIQAPCCGIETTCCRCSSMPVQRTRKVTGPPRESRGPSPGPRPPTRGPQPAAVDSGSSPKKGGDCNVTVARPTAMSERAGFERTAWPLGLMPGSPGLRVRVGDSGSPPGEPDRGHLRVSAS